MSRMSTEGEGMLRRTCFGITFAVIGFSTALAAQTPSTQTPSPAAQKPRAEDKAKTPRPGEVIVRTVKRQGQPINIKIEAVISDQRGSATPVKKTLSMIVGDCLEGLVRSDTEFTLGSPGGLTGPVPLHMDASPEILADGKIRLSFGLQYNLPRLGGADNNASTPGTLSPIKT